MRDARNTCRQINAAKSKQITDRPLPGFRRERLINLLRTAAWAK